MPTYKGNAGHLMQHWTLCKLVDIADEHAPGLHFIDAHAMAPWADTLDGNGDDRFRTVRSDLPGQRSVYERAWYQLAARKHEDGYPNSAAFVERVWTRDFSMLLCEIDPKTVDKLDTWLPHIQDQPRCKSAKIIPGDWRRRFGRGLPSPPDVGLPDGSFTLISFDPDMYYPDPPDNASERNLYPCDLERTTVALRDVVGGVIIQLSTYSRGNRNQAPQVEVIDSVNNILTQQGFTAAQVVRLNGDMMSLIYARNVPATLHNELTTLPDRFNEWRPG